jgi:hypothetical protein
MVTNLTALCFAMGNQGGTIVQVARDLGVEVQDIFKADEERMGDLLRIAQKYQRDKNKSDIQQTHITIGYFVYTTSDMDDTQVYINYKDMFDDWENKDSLMVREIVNHVAADNIYITPCYIVKKIMDDADDCSHSYRYEALR